MALTRSACAGSKPHKLKRRAAQEAVGVGQGFGQFEVVVVLADEEPRRLPGGGGGGEFAVLALEFGGLAGAVGDNERRPQPVEMADRAELLDRRVVEPDVIAS